MSNPESTPEPSLPTPEPKSPVSTSATLPDGANSKLIVPEWALRARTFLRKGLVVCAAGTAAGYALAIVGFAVGVGEWGLLFAAIPFAGIFIFSGLQVMLLAAGFVQYSLGQLLKYTLIGAACVSAIVGQAHWSIVGAGVLGLLWIAIVFFRAATDADVRQK